MVPFTNNYTDMSTREGYQFEFHCMRCGNGYASTFQHSVTGFGGRLLRIGGDLLGGDVGQKAAEVGWDAEWMRDGLRGRPRRASSSATAAPRSSRAPCSAPSAAPRRCEVRFRLLAADGTSLDEGEAEAEMGGGALVVTPANGPVLRLAPADLLAIEEHNLADPVPDGARILARTGGEPHHVSAAQRPRRGPARVRRHRCRGRQPGTVRGYLMLFMVIERFRDHDMVPIYQRVRDAGRSLPEGLEYVDSWVEPNFSRCFQLMRCDDLRRFQEWALSWRGYGVEFEIVPVVSSAETRDVVAPHLTGDPSTARP
jgi:hypothetical protein